MTARLEEEIVDKANGNLIIRGDFNAKTSEKGAINRGTAEEDVRKASKVMVSNTGGD